MTERHELRLENKLLVNIFQEGFESMGLTSNISRDGISVITTSVLPVNTIISLQLGVADETYLLKGEILWSKESANSPGGDGDGNALTGIKIIEAPEQYLKYVEKLLGGA